MNGRARADGTDTYGSVILGDSGAKKMDFQDQHEDDRTPITVGFVGNPNCGKTTLFNAFTGAKLKVANWPGVTVERVEGETSYKRTSHQGYRPAGHLQPYLLYHRGKGHPQMH